MHPSVLLLLLCGWSASSHSLPPKEVPLLPSTNKSAIIDEMLCLLENEDASLDVNPFPLALHQICFLR